jgi:hypothetical protein
MVKINAYYQQVTVKLLAAAHYPEVADGISFRIQNIACINSR